MLKGIIISLALTLLWVSAQIAAFHVRRPRRMFMSMVLLFTGTLPLLPLAYLLTPRDLFFLPVNCSRTPCWLGLGTSILLHILFFFAYVEFFYYVERAVTLRLLVELRKRSKSTLSGIRKAYNVDEMVEDRLGAMKENGFVDLVDGLWRLTPKGRLFAKTFILSRRILNLEAGQ